MQVISRAAAILRALKDSETELSLGRIAKRTGLPRSTVQRIAGALAEERLVAVDPERGGLRLGPGLESLAEAARASIVERCRGPMNDLAKETGETVDLSVMSGSAMVFQPGSRSPPPEGGFGGGSRVSAHDHGERPRLPCHARRRPGKSACRG